MYRILAVNSGVIDCEVMEDILSKKLEGPIEFLSASHSDEAIRILKEQSIQLLIVDVPQFTAYVNNIVWNAYSFQEDIHVILTSVQSEEKLLGLAHKLDVTAYLLKPYRTEDLVNLVQSLEVARQKVKNTRGKEKRSFYINQIFASMQEYKYRDCMNTAKEYIDYLYSFGDNMSLIRPKVMDFLTDIVEHSTSYSKDTQRKLQNQLEGFRSRYDLQSSGFEVLAVVEEMVDTIFQEMERYQLYHDDEIMKVLNFIDRNIKNSISLDDAATHINMSSSYFSKFFKKNTGTNFITYVTEEKMKFAKEMLTSTTMPIINIAFELSYNETNYFSKTFKRNVGLTPTEYRNHHTPEA